MASWYVNSAAAGTNAWVLAGLMLVHPCSQLLALAVSPPAAGDSIFILSTSAETYSTATTLTFKGTSAAPNYIYSTDNTNSPPQSTDLVAGASISTTGASALTITGTCYFYGITFSSGTLTNAANLLISNAICFAFSMHFDTCALNL